MFNLLRFTRGNGFLMPALDHRGSFEKMLNGKTELAIYVKKLIIEATYEKASGFLFDPKVGLPAYTEFTQSLPTRKVKPFLLCIEKSGYIDRNFERTTEMENNVSDLKKMGAKGVKILLFINPKSKSALSQIGIAQKVLHDCQRENVPFFLEFLTYEIPGIEFDLADSVISSLRMFLQNGVNPSVFKIEYPGNAKACQKITKMLGETPWILLTKAGDYDDFKNNLKTAVKNGASGFLAGRSLWQEFSDLPKNKWEEFFQNTVKKRFGEIVDIADKVV